MIDDLDEVKNKQSLLVQISKTHEHQIQTIKSDLWQLREIFQLFIKNNPALLYAKFNDQLQTLADHITILKDTLQMLQLQKLSTNTLKSW